MTRWRAHDDRGSAVTDFALVMPLLLLVAMAVVQLVLTMHVRSTMIAAAAEGARAAALAGAQPQAGEVRTREVLAEALGTQTAQIQASRIRIAGAPAIRVQVTGNLPLFGLVGPQVLTVEGHAFVEQP
ncbi:MAG: TadE family protein [Actinomycetes bacterium]|nr:pilus assembly protein [Candidatus Nanopelagicales bacterium]MDP4825763.1 pilus assembly protein [Candidatus Nanopelagicales bacterium]MDP4888113.1 pilus assembly protein [Candidatus Nanopelagicales bacterium]